MLFQDENEEVISLVTRIQNDHKLKTSIQLIDLNAFYLNRSYMRGSVVNH